MFYATIIIWRKDYDKYATKFSFIFELALTRSNIYVKLDRSSNSSVYTIENDIRNDQDILGCDKKTGNFFDLSKQDV